MKTLNSTTISLRKLKTVIIVCGIFLLLDSCVSSKKLKYFSSIPSESHTQVVITNLEMMVKGNNIKPSDILNIAIANVDPVTSAVLNSASGGGSTSTTGASAVSGYLVDDSGKIKIPFIGTIKAAGMNKEQLADTIYDRLVQGKFAIDPIVIVRITNFKITILGEVNRPGVITVPNERITLPEAIGMAGDLTIYGKRDNILLIREKDGKRIFKRFSLNSNEMFNSEIYFLQSQDIIYVEPSKSKAATLDRSTQTFSFVLSTVSVFLLIYTQFIAP